MRFLNHGKIYWFVAVAVVFLLLDQLSKLYVKTRGLSFIYNEAFAFSLPLPVGLMYAVYFLVIGIVSWHLYLIWNKLSPLELVGWGLIAGGGLSNLCERIVEGKVVDFIYVSNGVFNFADGFIFLGVILILIKSFNFGDWKFKNS